MREQALFAEESTGDRPVTARINRESRRIGNAGSALRGTCQAVRPKYTQRFPAEFEYGFNRRFDLPAIIPRLACVALRTPPMPERLLTLRLAWEVIGNAPGEDV